MRVHERKTVLAREVADMIALSPRDIIEGVNNQPENSITLHTSDSECKQDTTVDVTGKPIPEKRVLLFVPRGGVHVLKSNEAHSDDCNANVKSNQGCSFREVADASYGEPFNKAGKRRNTRAPYIFHPS